LGGDAGSGEDEEAVLGGEVHGEMIRGAVEYSGKQERG
jgi:hypothetical protein